MVRRDGPAGFPQLFILDPDRNIIEINGGAIAMLPNPSNARRDGLIASSPDHRRA